jgi:hypothetical protein
MIKELGMGILIVLAGSYIYDMWIKDTSAIKMASGGY